MDPSSNITLKTYVNTRAPLADRVPKRKAADHDAVKNISLHHSKETTYDIDYNPYDIELLGGGTGRFTARDFSEGGRPHSGSLRRTKLHEVAIPSANNSQGDNIAYPNGGMGGGAGNGGSGGDSSGDGLAGANGSGADAAQKYLSAYKTTSHPSSMWESEAHAATRNVQPDQRLDFYSNVRKIEAKDDEARGGLVGSIQRSMDIAHKRATDPSMKMPTPQYERAEVAEYPIVAAHEKRIVKRNYLDLVECTYLDPDTEQQIGYNAEPQTRLPGLDLSQEHSVQSKAITHMGTSEELFRGYPKFVDDKPVTYAGHVPSHPRNLAARMEGIDCRKEYPKCIMTLAIHGGGVDSSVSGNSVRGRMRRGRNAPALQMLKPKTDASLRMTQEGDMLLQPFQNTTEKERQINKRCNMKSIEDF